MKEDQASPALESVPCLCRVVRGDGGVLYRQIRIHHILSHIHIVCMHTLMHVFMYVRFLGLYGSIEGLIFCIDRNAFRDKMCMQAELHSLIVTKVLQRRRDPHVRVTSRQRSRNS